MQTNTHRSTRPTHRTPLAALALMLLTGLGALTPAVHAQAQTPAPGGESAAMVQLARDFLEPSLATAMGQADGAPLRAEVVMGTLDSRLRLAPCARIEPHMPPGSRLWGRSRIGLRCVDGTARWNVFLPVTVKAWGPAWVLTRPITAGTPLTQEDAEIAEIDWAEQKASVLASPALWVGQEAAYTLLAGQALRQNMVRPAQVFAAGSQVRVTQSGTGFQIAVTGQALSAGQIGQTTRVRLSGGRVVTGLVRDGQTVELAM